MTTLYELTGELLQLLEMAEDPEIDEQALADTMEAVEGEFEIKADGYAKVITQLELQAQLVDAEMKRLAKKKKAFENNAKYIKQRLEDAMKATGKVKFKTDLFSFGIQKNGGKLPLIVKEDIDYNEVPAEYLIFSDPTLDNDEIRKALDAGVELDFVKYGERGEGLRIR